MKGIVLGRKGVVGGGGFPYVGEQLLFSLIRNGSCIRQLMRWPSLLNSANMVSHVGNARFRKQGSWLETNGMQVGKWAGVWVIDSLSCSRSHVSNQVKYLIRLRLCHRKTCT